jgi:hypothetical protein
MRWSTGWAVAISISLATVPTVTRTSSAQVQAEHEAGTVKSTDSTGLTLTTTAGQDVVVTVPATAKVQMVAPGSKDLKSATDGLLADVANGDRVLVIGSPGEAGAPMTAQRVIVMKAQAIAQTHEAEGAAWAKGGGGIVKSVDPTAGKVVIASGMKDVTVVMTPQTVVRRYAKGSVSYADAKMSSIGAIQPGDQMRVRGTRSADGATITADEVVAGRFENYSGLLAAVNASASTVTLRDLKTKKDVTVAVTQSSDLRRIPPMLAQRIAMQMKGGGAAPGGGPGAGMHGGPGSPAPERREDQGRDVAREGQAGMDLSKMLSRLPTETLSGLKAGDAVMIVASSPAGGAGDPTAVTLLVGVDPILTASPAGRTMTLSPWSVGGGEGEGAGGAEEAGPQH